MLAATVRLETPFAVAVFAPAEEPDLWDIARDHYGSHTPISACGSIGQVIRAVTEGQASVGVLPMPQEGDLDPWWRHALSPDENPPRVIARLPFGRPRQRPRHGRAKRWQSDMARSRRPAPTEPCSSPNRRPTSAARDFLELLSSLGLAGSVLASWEYAGGAFNLIEIDGFCRAFRSASDPFSRAAWRGAVSPAAVRRLCPAAARGGARLRRSERLKHNGHHIRPGAAPWHSRHRPLCRRRGQDRRDRAADSPRLERKRAGPEPQGDGRLSGARRRNPPLSRRQRRDITQGDRAAVTGSTRRGSSAAPARTS